MAVEHTVGTLAEKVDLLDRFYAERHASQQAALAKAFDASQLAIVHAREVTDAKIAALSGNQGDALKWIFAVILIVIAAILGHIWK
jgi:hypothetical protein